MEIKSLEYTDFDTLFHSFERAFADYDIHFEKEEVRSMLTRRGYNPRLSFAAFDRGEIVAFTFNGIGTFHGIPTAYDTGTGTVKEYRGQGLAGQVFDFALPHLREAGIRQYLLEVLQNNDKAISVYRRMDFRTTGEFLCFRQTIESIRLPKAAAECTIEPVGIEFIQRSQSFADFLPSWQNSMESIIRGASGLTFLGATVGGSPAGFCVFDPATGDISQIAVSREFRRRGIATRLLQEAVQGMRTDYVKVLNIRSTDSTLPAFLESRNIPLASRQFEMVRGV